MNDHLRFTALTLLLLFQSGCVSIPKIAANGSAALTPYAEIAVRRSPSYESFYMGAPAGLQLLEASLTASPDNLKLLVALAKGYNAYANIAGETEKLLADHQDKTPADTLALDYHTLAVSRARRYLEQFGVPWGASPVLLDKALAEVKRETDIIDVAFVASHSLKSLMALQRGRPSTMTYAPIADALSKFACNGSLKPSYPSWACDAMVAVEMAEKPAIIGGSTEQSAKIFRDIYNRNPDSLMPLALWAQYSLTKKFSRDDWRFIKDAFTLHKSAMQNRQVVIATAKNAPLDDEYALLNAAATRRLDFIVKHENDFF
jgi:hypothetical protein